MLLGAELKSRGVDKENPLILGILRGGMVVARELARALKGDLDLALSRKLGAPFNPELAIGAISESGDLFLNKRIASHVGADASYIAQEKERQIEVISQRVAYYREDFPPIAPRGRYVVITDDGVATGATMQACLWAVRKENPRSLLVALPVGPEDSLRTLSEDADEIICLRVPDSFAAVGQFYHRFDQTEDEEVRTLLSDARKRGVE